MKTINSKILEEEIKKYMATHKNIKKEEIDIKNIFNLTNITNSIVSKVKKYFSRNKTIHNQLINLNYGNEKISNYMQVEFKRKNKEYTKTYIFILLKVWHKI